MKKLIQQIDQFCKLANQIGESSADLESLLKEALSSGSRDDFLIFLDRLEETNPLARKEIMKGGLRKTLSILSKLFPHILEQQKYHDQTYFKTPTFGGFKMIGFSRGPIPDYAQYQNFYQEKYRLIFSKTLLVNDDYFKSIWNSSKGFKLHYNGNTFDPKDSNKIKEIWNEHEAKFKDDMSKLEQLLLTIK